MGCEFPLAWSVRLFFKYRHSSSLAPFHHVGNHHVGVDFHSGMHDLPQGNVSPFSGWLPGRKRRLADESHIEKRTQRMPQAKHHTPCQNVMPIHTDDVVCSHPWACQCQQFIHTYAACPVPLTPLLPQVGAGLEHDRKSLASAPCCQALQAGVRPSPGR